ncbi:hypothetical protein MTHERMMSTA1_21210 [Methanosarcina thermophila MST-A1]|uniref:Uncharacterized protein n=1 Tax=Methanosarcina thermophila TaxID=2210 RepID=A0A3G9CVQ6_METTE|nr:conserved hypothetical protein [Methanosarcina thermophila]GLI14995.1 hypothetical protein MTHERMMSTA1_21210 [Methanosarcina thermophila MST-A1]
MRISIIYNPLLRLVSLDLLTFINIYYLFTLLTLRKNSPAKQIESQIINAGSAGVKKKLGSG